jgi:hypothetical protein
VELEAELLYEAIEARELGAGAGRPARRAPVRRHADGGHQHAGGRGGEEAGYLIIDEREAGGAVAEGEGGQRQAPGRHPGLQLGGPVAPGPEDLEQGVELGAVEGGEGGVAPQGLDQAQLLGHLPEVPSAPGF